MEEKAISWEGKKLKARQQSILIGSLLGDGRLECRSKQGSARFRVHHADSQRELLFWKYNEFKEFVKKTPWKTAWYDGRYNRSYASWFFHTITSQLFTSAHQLFYPKAEKQVPKKLIQYLDPLALAVWIADDGCRTPYELILNTQSFSFTEQQLLLNILNERYSIVGSINKDRENYRLRFDLHNLQIIRNLVKKFQIPTFKTKLAPVTTSSQRRWDSGSPVTGTTTRYNTSGP